MHVNPDVLFGVLETLLILHDLPYFCENCLYSKHDFELMTMMFKKSTTEMDALLLFGVSEAPAVKHG